MGAGLTALRKLAVRVFAANNLLSLLRALDELAVRIAACGPISGRGQHREGSESSGQFQHGNLSCGQIGPEVKPSRTALPVN